MVLTRRDFIRGVIVSVAVAEGCSSGDMNAAPGDGARFFPQSVASGDPRPTSIVLWTRLHDDATTTTDPTLTLEVATDAAFASTVVRKSDLTASAEHDGVVKIRLTGLTARTTYYYRFVYTTAGQRVASRTGRTRTAPLATDDVPVRFAVATCQDFVGRYYNAWRHLVDLDADLDFVLFVGDYVYETTGDPGFMVQGGARSVTFSDEAGAMALGAGNARYFAAQSLSNYRDLYKTVRSDGSLRAAHERYPFVFMWDDHEYSDDAHGSTSTYTDGLVPEQNDERKRNAERAYFEYVPIDHPDDTHDVTTFDDLPVYPATRIYRDLGYGQNMRLLVADCRSYRADHLIPEDAYPAAVVVDEGELAALGLAEAFGSDAFAYVDVDAPELLAVKTYLTVAYLQLAQAAGLDAAQATERARAVVSGRLALAYVNAILTSPALNLPPIDPTGKPRGIAWVHMGKRDLFASQGARYVVVKDTFDVYAAVTYAKSQGQSESTFGAAQTAWLDAALAQPEPWKVLVSSFSLTAMVIDLRDKQDVEDPSVRNRYYLNTDQWDGFPRGRTELLAKLAALPGPGALVVSGDIHASFASVESGVPCLTTPAISSGSIQAGAKGVVNGAGFADDSAVFRYVVTEMNASFAEANAGIAFSDTDSHGFMVVEIGSGADRDRARVTFHLIPSAEVTREYSGPSEALAAKFVTRSFAVQRGVISAV